ncbi:unnamed protein product [Penicillium olsonii]|nr:unnamed protein product [Penicillium olsonii]CAG7921337.1 unnamed protein product [Penicillium olsonii]
MARVRGPSTSASTITILDEKLTDANATALAQFLHDHNLAAETLPFWLVNIPRSQWTAECPGFLHGQPPKNIQCLSTPDDHYTRQDWAQVKAIIGQPGQIPDAIIIANSSFIETNRIDLFQRVPSELRKYLEYMAQIKAEYSSVMRFVIKERLQWGDGKLSDLQPRGKPFEFDGMGWGEIRTRKKNPH